MNSPSDGGLKVADGMPVFGAGGAIPFEFRLLTQEDTQDMQSVSADRQPIGAGAARGEQRRLGYMDAATWESSRQASAEAARAEGFQEGEREGRRAMRAELEAQGQQQSAMERERVHAALEQFRSARARYFAQVEQEVVKLALAIAARVLHREVQLDPLLLAGAVRVALEKMADRSAIVLRVATGDVPGWELGLVTMQPHDRPQVMEDAQLARGDCALETSMGTVELGVQIQLQEIEKGFFDLLNHRPAN